MKKIGKYLLLCLIVLITLPCFTMQVPAEDNTISIVCTNSILADFTSNILTENVSIEYIMPAGVCPSHFDTSPGDVSMILSADIIVSLGWEPWLESLLISSGNTDVKQIKCADLGEWNYPAGAKVYVEKLQDELSDLLLEHNNTIQTNAEEYITEIDETTEKLKDMVENRGHLNKKVICMQWQKDFVEWLGLDVNYSYAPPESLSTQDMLNIIDVASRGDICAVIDNLQSGTEFGARVASETGASHIIFTNFPGAIPGTDNYLDMITYNTQQLVNGIATYEYLNDAGNDNLGKLSALETELARVEMERNIFLFTAGMFIVIAVVLLMFYKRK